MNQKTTHFTQNFEYDALSLGSLNQNNPFSLIPSDPLLQQNDSIYVHSDEEPAKDTAKARQQNDPKPSKGFLFDEIMQGDWEEDHQSQPAFGSGEFLGSLFGDEGDLLGKRSEFAECDGGSNLFGDCSQQGIQNFDSAGFHKKNKAGYSSTEADLQVEKPRKILKKIKVVENMIEISDSKTENIFKTSDFENEKSVSDSQKNNFANVDSGSFKDFNFISGGSKNSETRNESNQNANSLQNEINCQSQLSIGAIMFDAEGDFKDLRDRYEADRLQKESKIVNPNRPLTPLTPTPKPEKEKIFKDNNINLFKIEEFFGRFLKSKPITPELFLSLTKFERRLIAKILQKTHRFNCSMGLNYQDLVHLQSQGIPKRTEENYKCVYKPFLRVSLDRFKPKSRQQKNKMQAQKLDPRLYSDLRRLFYYRKFASLCESSADFSIDLIMDICHEKTVVSKGKRAEPLTVENNWGSTPKCAAMKKISGAFRFLVASTPHFRREFTEFVRESAKKGLFNKQEAIIDAKLSSKFKQWRKIYKSLAGNDSEFMEKVLLEIRNPKFKFPWSIVNVSKAVEQCVQDLENLQNEEEFFELQRKHYSFCK